MAYQLDTDWIISFLNGRPDAVEVVRKLADEGISLSVISAGEVIEGLHRTPDPVRRIRQFEDFAANLEVIAPGMDVARQYGVLRSRLRAAGQPIPDNDLWIAATAVTFGLTLVSRDQHFSRVPGLALYSIG